MKIKVIFIPYCNFATSGLSLLRCCECVARGIGEEQSYMKVNIFLRIVNGRGTIRSMKRAISATRRRKTYIRKLSVFAFKFVTGFQLFSIETDGMGDDRGDCDGDSAGSRLTRL